MILKIMPIKYSYQIAIAGILRNNTMDGRENNV